MKRLICSVVVISMFFTCFTAVTWAESATKKEVTIKCEAAVRLIQEVGVDNAAGVIGDKSGPFVWKDAYVFLMDIDGKMIAHPMSPEMVKEDNILQVADTNGKKITVAFIKVAIGSGKGWVNYMWPKPGRDQPAPKSAYILRVPNTPYFVGSGIYQ
ncbi:conserved uncharacterized protein, Cache domain family [Desulfosarcina variabilis str. Montpellier]|uniref:cache domain-containing protein n=1 Tax=Desulfosarcina variabilis TaxID=2300 RepID=UPI003AFAE2B4